MTRQNRAILVCHHRPNFITNCVGAVPSDCCRQKTVGDKMYELVGLEDTSQYNCLQHCVYREMMEQRSENRFCFAAGDMEGAVQAYVSSLQYNPVSLNVKSEQYWQYLLLH